ncbi:PREDICTED: UPF0573 protein C2orf70 homolog [Elephantulus edwardii]|uniref:UPF0573 protein C2orf70 homolog n=1 Tax=Elephantulus edwardii TaxID=28737 RepID=UPI0003F0AE6C|nr:PREDICTED: UPF0573 protein C2orf70 homolog [Elephantulus edwardii]
MPDGAHCMQPSPGAPVAEKEEEEEEHADPTGGGNVGLDTCLAGSCQERGRLPGYPRAVYLLALGSERRCSAGTGCALAAPTMSSLSGTLLTEFNAAHVAPSLMPGYGGHIPGQAFSCGSTYGNTTLKYFQDCRNAAMEKSHFSHGGHFPPIFSPDPSLVLSSRSNTNTQDRDRLLLVPSYTRYNLDSSRCSHLTHFYQSVQQHREYYRDKTGKVPRVPYFVLPVKESEHYPLPTQLPPLSPKDKWHLLRVAPENLKTYQTFPSGKRVSPQERQKRDCYFEFRA